MITTVTLILAAAVLALLAVGMGWVLGWASRVFHVEIDPKEEATMTEGAAPDFSGAAELTAGIERSLGRVAGEVHASDVFGVTHESGDRVVITAAALERAGGFGFGSGGGGEGAEAGSGGGGGGGGSAAGRAVAAIEIAPGE